MDDQGDHAGEHAARRADIDRAYNSLPPAGTSAYWAALNAPDGGDQGISLEVLARCLRQWHADLRPQETAAVFDIIQRHVQSRVEAWANRLASQAPGKAASGLADDLTQECYLALWSQLLSSREFLLVNFMWALKRIQGHVAQQVMQREGVWRRASVEQARRVPAKLIDSLDEPARPGLSSAPATGDSNRLVVESIPDANALAAFTQAEFFADVGEATRQLTPAQRLLLNKWLFEDLSQEEIAADLGISDRMVRYRLQTLKAAMRSYYEGADAGASGARLRSDTHHDQAQKDEPHD